MRTRREVFRGFIAVGLPEGVRAAAGRLAQAWQREVRDVRWVKPELMHLTVKFLGDTPLDMREEIGERIREAVKPLGAFSLTLRGAGVFPSADRARVLFIDVAEGAGEMSAVTAAVDRAMTRLGFPAEKRRAVPHLTVGRVRERAGRVPVHEWLRSNSEVTVGACTVESVELYASELRPTGPVYTVLGSFPLVGGGAREGES